MRLCRAVFATLILYSSLMKFYLNTEFNGEQKRLRVKHFVMGVLNRYILLYCLVISNDIFRFSKVNASIYFIQIAVRIC